MALPDPGDRGPDGPAVVVPDDARDLARDVEALERERRAARRQARRGSALRRLLQPGRARVVPAALVAAVLVVVAAYAALPVLLRPRFPAEPAAQPLASPAVPPGQVGGLLPQAPVRTPAGPTTTRGLVRPAVLVLVPTACDGCSPAPEPGRVEQVVREVVDQALQVTRHVRLLSTGAQDPAGEAVEALRRGPARGLVTSGVDELSALSLAYGGPPEHVAVVVVGADGVVLAAVPDVAPGQRLDRELARLQSAGRLPAPPA